MFTGIVQYVGRVTDVRSVAAGRRLRIDAGPLAGRLAPGASLAVDGACLTAVGVQGRQAEFDVVPETLARTTLGGLARGARVNLEPALAAGDALDGHIVQGHVDGLARACAIDRAGGRFVLHFSADTELTGGMVPKGSVAVAGVSLTLAEVADGRFAAALVPTTLERTTLGGLAIGEAVNVELDVIGKYVRKHLAAMSGGEGLTIQKLREEGFA